MFAGLSDAAKRRLHASVTPPLAPEDALALFDAALASDVSVAAPMVVEPRYIGDAPPAVLAHLAATATPTSPAGGPHAAAPPEPR